MERDIDYVIAVAECKSISRAADLLYISQPSLSRYLSNLEDELGVNLFIRTINGTELTEAGKIYLEYAKEIHLLRGTMKYKLREFQKSKTNRIRIGMTLNAASLSAFNVEAEVKKKYPDCSIELFNIFSRDMEAALRERKYDFAIGPNLGLPPEFAYDKLYRDPYILVVPDRYDIEAHAERRDSCKFPFVDLRKLPPMDYILQEDTTFVRKGINRLLQNLGCAITPRLLVTSSTLAMQAAENGIGACIVVVGHLAYLNHIEHLRFYQISDVEYSSAGVVYLRNRKFSKEEKYCTSCIRRALLAGEEEIIKRLETAGRIGGIA